MNFYLDPTNGNDATTDTPLGFWSVPFTGGSVAAPAAAVYDAAGDLDTPGELATGGVSGSTARVTAIVLTSGTWAGGNAAGTMYFYGYSAAFQAEQVNFSGGGHMDIAADLSVCAWQTIKTGATAARIAPGDRTMIAKTAGGVTSIGNATWKSGGAGDAINIVSSTNASPIVIETEIAHGMVTGDYASPNGHSVNTRANGWFKVTRIDDTHLSLDGSTGNGVGGASGTIRKTSDRAIELATAQTVLIDNCETAWTAANGATVTLEGNTGVKQGSCSIKIAKTSGIAANTLYAYVAKGGASGLDLSALDGLTHWFTRANANAAGNWKVCLCSNADGTGIVDTFLIPAFYGGTSYPVALNILKNGGGKLGAAIKSIAIYSGATPANSTIYLDNISAYAIGGLHLNSLISKSSAEKFDDADEGWYAIDEISDTLVAVRGAHNQTQGYGRGYCGSGLTIAPEETVTTYIRETTQTDPNVSGATVGVGVVNDSGTAGSYIEWCGGYNTATGERDGETIFNGLNGAGMGLNLSGMSYNKFLGGMSFCAYAVNVYLTGTPSNNWFVKLQNCVSPQSNNLALGGAFHRFDEIKNFSGGTVSINMGSSRLNTFITVKDVNNTTSAGFNFSAGSHANLINSIAGLKNHAYGSSGAGGLLLLSNNNTINSLTGCVHNGNGVNNNNANGNVIKNFQADDNSDGAVRCMSGILRINGATIAGTETGAFTVSSDSKVLVEDFNATNVHKIYTDGGYSITYDTGDGTFGWKTYPTDATRTSEYPIKVKLDKIYCAADRQIYVRATVQKSHATDIGAKLLVAGGQIAGVAADVEAVKAEDTDEETLSLTFTPTEAGSVDVEFVVWYAANDADENVLLKGFHTNANEYGKVFLSNTPQYMELDAVDKYDTKTDNPYTTEATQATVHAYTGISYDGTLRVTEPHTKREIYDWGQDYCQVNPGTAPFFTTTDGINHDCDVDMEISAPVTDGGTITMASGKAFTGVDDYDGMVISDAYDKGKLQTAAVLDGHSVAVIDDTGTQRDYQVSVTGAYSFYPPAGATGTYTVVIKKPGYDSSTLDWVPENGELTEFVPFMPKLLMTDGSDMYQGTSGAACSVVYAADSSKADIYSNDAAVSHQLAFDTVERSLITAAGMKWLWSGKNNITIDTAINGDNINLTYGWRLWGTGLNSSVQAFVKSQEATIVDPLSPFPVPYMSVPPTITPQQIADAVDDLSATGATVAAKLDAAVSSRLADADYTAPANANIAAIKERTDNLPDEPAAAGDIPAAPDNAGIAAIKAKTDNLPSGVKKNTALPNFTFVMTDASGNPKSGLTVTAERSQDGGGFAPCTLGVEEIANGYYSIDLQAGDLDADIVALRFSAANARDTNITIKTQV